jgi:Cytochrome c554 and c-prime
MKRALSFAAAVWLCAVLLATVRADTVQSPGATSAARWNADADTSMFAHSSDCLACHNELVTPSGEDVSIGANWRGSMMANAARDPYVRASVRRETIDHPLRADDIEEECAKCHMPAAAKIARAVGGKGQVFAHLSRGAGATSGLDNLATDGVSCTVCHQIAPDRLGTPDSLNGNFVVAAPLVSGKRRAFGPSNPDAGRRRIMHSVTGFEQEQATHIRESELCATCHTLITEALGADGRVIGSLPEQMNYQEWRHSAFFQEKRSCQSCHMPLAQGPVRIASVLGDYRESLSRHTFVGGNAFMLRLMNRYRAELGVEATSAELEATARATIRQLERDTATVAVEAAVLADGTLAVDVVVRNMTGHKFPTGYPSRRTWLHVAVRDTQGRTLFESGRVTEEGLIEGNASDAGGDMFEPHYEEITRSDQVQIYESIMGTPAGLPTTGLLQATQYLKDNRLLPRGFDKQTAQAGIRVVGAADADDDFADGGDRVRYRIPSTTGAPVTVEVELRFQPIGYRWAHNLAAYEAPEPRKFLGYYKSLASSSSVVVARVSWDVGP